MQSLSGGGAGIPALLAKIEELEQQVKTLSEKTTVKTRNIASSILEYVLSDSVSTGTVAFFILSGSGYYGNDLPGSNYQYGTAIVIKRGPESINVMVFPEDATLKPIRNSRKNNVWLGWRFFDGTAFS